MTKFEDFEKEIMEWVSKENDIPMDILKIKFSREWSLSASIDRQRLFFEYLNKERNSMTTVKTNFESVVMEWKQSQEGKAVHATMEQFAYNLNKQLEANNISFCAVVHDFGLTIEPCIRKFNLEGKFTL